MASKYNLLPEIAKNQFDWFCGQSIVGKREDVIQRLMNLSLDYKRCGSPIEIIFNLCFDLIMCFRDNPLTLIPQYEIQADENTRYFLDFALIYDDAKLAIECDGHDFHEKTADQVIYGNNRDYNLKMHGFDVLHFTGTEICNDPFECVKKTLKYFEQMVKKG